MAIDTTAIDDELKKPPKKAGFFSSFVTKIKQDQAERRQLKDLQREAYKEEYKKQSLEVAKKMAKFTADKELKKFKESGSAGKFLQTFGSAPVKQLKKGRIDDRGPQLNSGFNVGLGTDSGVGLNVSSYGFGTNLRNKKPKKYDGWF